MITVRKLARTAEISNGTAQWVMSEDLELRPYKIRMEPNLSADRKKTRGKHFQLGENKCHDFWQRDYYVFLDEKPFNVDGTYNAQNDRIWVTNRAASDAQGGISRKQKFPQGVMVQDLGVTKFRPFAEVGAADYIVCINWTVNISLNWIRRLYRGHFSEH